MMIPGTGSFYKNAPGRGAARAAFLLPTLYAPARISTIGINTAEKVFQIVICRHITCIVNQCEYTLHGLKACACGNLNK